MRCHQRAYTLIELVIALALGMLVVNAALSAYQSQGSAQRAATDIARIDEAGSVALDLLAGQLRMAGFAPLGDARPVGLFACAHGRPEGQAEPVCKSLASDSDGVLIRYIGDGASTWPTVDGQATDCLGQGIGAAQGMVENRFYARSSPSTREPELHCSGNGRDRIGQALVEGIERLRLRYWWRGAWIDATQVGDWAQVTAVDLCVQVRGQMPVGARYFDDCDGRAMPVGDGVARRSYRRIVAVRNQVPS